MLTVHAYAKINLTLEVLGKRADGYHDIASVLQTIDLADVLSFEPSDELKFTCRDFDGVRSDLLEESILKAAGLLHGETGCNSGALIRMEQLDIPRAAGLGSSSTDSAAVLKGLNELWSLGLSLDDLTRLAAKLGSDTPFFIRGGTALAEGRGEKITPLPSPAHAWLLMLNPPISPVNDKTAKMYGMLTPSHFDNGKSTRNLVVTLLQGTSLNSNLLCNTFENVALAFFPGFNEYRQKLLDAGVVSVHLAGAGPTLFSMVSNKAQGELLANLLGNDGLQTFLVCTC